MIKVPIGIKHDHNIALVREAIETSRLHEQINGPWKMKGKNAGDQFNGVLVVRVKSKQQYEHMKTALREIEEDIGKTCIFPDPDWSKLPAFKPMKISIVPVNNGEHVRADGATYNLRSFLGLIGFEWRRADNFARQFVKARHWHEPDGTTYLMRDDGATVVNVRSSRVIWSRPNPTDVLAQPRSLWGGPAKKS